MNVIIEIEELVLHGFPAGDRYAIAEALTRELSRLIAERLSPNVALAAPGSMKMDFGLEPSGGFSCHAVNRLTLKGACAQPRVQIADRSFPGQFVLSPAARGEAVGVAAGGAVMQVVEAVLAGDRSK